MADVALWIGEVAAPEATAIPFLLIDLSAQVGDRHTSGREAREAEDRPNEEIGE